MSDTIKIDNELIEQLRVHNNYDSQFATSGKSFTDIIERWIEDFINSVFGNGIYVENRSSIWATIGIVLFLLVVVIFIYKNPKLFSRRNTDEPDASDTPDTIYGIDFDSKIAAALAATNFNEAVRYIYLKTLRLLSDSDIISWQPFKTPSQYAREYRNSDFRQLTLIFTKVRYSDYKATETVYTEALGRSKEVSEEVNRMVAAAKEPADDSAANNTYGKGGTV